MAAGPLRLSWDSASRWNTGHAGTRSGARLPAASNCSCPASEEKPVAVDSGLAGTVKLMFCHKAFLALPF